MPTALRRLIESEDVLQKASESDLPAGWADARFESSRGRVWDVWTLPGVDHFAVVTDDGRYFKTDRGSLSVTVVWKSWTPQDPKSKTISAEGMTVVRNKTAAKKEALLRLKSVRAKTVALTASI